MKNEISKVKLNLIAKFSLASYVASCNRHVGI